MIFVLLFILKRANKTPVATLLQAFYEKLLVFFVPLIADHKEFRSGLVHACTVLATKSTTPVGTRIVFVTL